MLVREMAREAVAGAVAEGRIAVSEPLGELAPMSPIDNLGELGAAQSESPAPELAGDEEVET